MHRVIRTLVVTLALVLSPVAVAQHSHSSSHSSGSGHHSGGKSKSPKAKPSHKNPDGTVHVEGYYRKDGTYVHPYDRSAPGSSTHLGNPESHVPYQKEHVAPGYEADSTVTRDKHGRIKRSKTARADFQREHPCPCTGKTIG